MTQGGRPEPGIVVEKPGLQTTVQDPRGRLGYWGVGVPPSGAMDSLSMELANRMVGNPTTAAGLEFTVTGATLRFDQEAIVALAGAEMSASVDGRLVPFWQPLPMHAGSVLEVGGLKGCGMRAYLGVRGGIDVPVVLDSRATFTLGEFGGFEGRELQPGDRLPVGSDLVETGLSPSALRPLACPAIVADWSLGVAEGPHADGEFFTAEGIDELLAATWTVQSHAARTGVRLTGPTPAWARADGGEAGLHPSNIHDNGYAFAAVDFTGDTPVILGPDGPSLGGFTCPFTVVAAERWKLGQLAPGNTVRFHLLSEADAEQGRLANQLTVQRLRSDGSSASSSGHGSPRQSSPSDGGILARRAASNDLPEITFRRAGDEFLLIEFGPMVLDLQLRARVHSLEEWLTVKAVDAVVDLTAGIRSLLVHYDPDQISQAELLDMVTTGIDSLPELASLVIPGRTVHLPLSWEDPSTLLAIERYMQVVRDDAPWCPSNLEFIRRINGLESIDAVRDVVFDARYLVLGLGDVYLGAPVATPLDPRHRLITTKYNPARTWTPQNAVGIGGAYLCIYGMEGPGGYQFVGRTVPVWYLDTDTPGSEPEVPWLLRKFDQLRFHPVSTEELADLRSDAVAGELKVAIEPTDFSLADYEAALVDNADSIDEFRANQRGAFDAERERWRQRGELA